MHPLQLLGFIFWGGLALAVIRTLRHIRRFRTDEFGFSALSLIGWLSIFSFLAGFSIGAYLAVINIAIGLIVLLLNPPYRLHTMFVTLATLLLLASMRGAFPVAHLLLVLLLVGGLAFSFFQVFQFWVVRQNKQFSQACLQAMAILFFLSLLLNNFVLILVVLVLISLVWGILSIMLAKHFRWHFAVLFLTTATWASVIALQLFNGV